MPRTVEDALAVSRTMLIPGKIAVRMGGKYPEVIRYSAWKKPEITKEEEVDSTLPF
jgi:hypothetical protein